MRAIILTSISAVLLSGCLTTQENPNYEFSSKYKGDPSATHQYADAVPAETTAATYETVQPIYAQETVTAASTVMPSVGPTDSAYGSRVVSGTPGYMAMQADQQGAVQMSAAPRLPAAQMVSTAPMAAAGRPIEYDYSRNLIVADTAMAGSAIPNTVVRLQPNLGQAYTVQSGDTVYSLSRRTCVGVNVIQSMNGLQSDYGIKIGQELTLPASIC